MIDIANAPFHLRGWTTICLSDMLCFCMMAFRINRRVGFDKNHLLSCYHKAPAANTSIASGLLGIKGRGRPSFLIIPKGWQGHNLYPSLAERFFHILRSIWVLSKNGFLECHCSHFWGPLSIFGVFSIKINAERFGTKLLVWDKISRFICMWILVVHTGSCSHLNENCAFLCDLRESSSALIKQVLIYFTSILINIQWRSPSLSSLPSGQVKPNWGWQLTRVYRWRLRVWRRLTTSRISLRRKISKACSGNY